MVQGGVHPRWRRRSLIVLGIVLLAINLRGPIAAVGPVLDLVTDDLALSVLAVSVLTAAPVVCFGVFGVLTPWLVHRVGLNGAAVSALALLSAGLLLRSGPSAATLFAGTVLAAGAIAVGNVLLPTLVKRDAPRHPGVMTGVYTTCLTGSAAIGAATVVPVSTAYGWRGGLGIWAVPAVLGLLVWAPRLRGSTAGRVSTLDRPGGVRSLLGQPLAWQVTVFMGLQSAGFYAVLAWLPLIYRSAGISAADAGLLLALATATGIPMALTVPAWAARCRDQRVFPVVLTLFTTAGFVGVLLAPAVLPALWAVLIGAGLGGNFPLALTLVVLRTARPADTAALSTMAQGLGYLIAATVGPFAVGVVHELAGGWSAPLGLLVALSIPQALAGWLAGRPHVLGSVGPDRP
ncbi:MAG: MFS transporter [Actinobacteria bacterium]|uniref:CynX/NimT family MFS transporter n=1 Tax=Ornithinimicrobium sp. TaxID=1977084 RepID=UPI0017D563E6|nr:MFS transporter [Actinomycetota bacterium]